MSAPTWFGNGGNESAQLRPGVSPTTEDSTFREDARTLRNALDQYEMWGIREGWTMMAFGKPALDRILTSYESMKRERDEAEFRFESYVAEGPSSKEAREMLLESLSRLTRYEEALREIGGSHDRVGSDPAQHCTDLARIARSALSEGKGGS